MDECAGQYGDHAPDSTADDFHDRWMTFAELAAVRGVSKASAIKLVRRHGWRRQRDNEGNVRTLVPPAWAARQELSIAGTRDSTAESPPDISRAISALQDANAGLVTRADRAEAEADRERGRADRAEARADALAGRVDTLQAALERAQGDTQAAEGRAEALHDRIEGLQAQVATAEAEADTARAAAGEATQAADALRKAEADLRAHGLWRRLRSAWRRSEP